MKIIVMATAIYGIYCAMLFGLQRKIMFPRYMIPPPVVDATRSAGIEPLWLEASFGRVEAWFMPAMERNIPAPVVVFAHGNGELIDHWPMELKPFTRMGLHVLLVEYPGYGRSEGKPGEDTVTEVFTLAYDAVTARKDVDASRIVLFGRSVGGGAVCSLAARRPTRAMILMSTFTGVRDLAGRYLVPGFLVRDPFDNMAVVRNYPHPILIIHGEHDEIIPVRHGKRLHQNAPDARIILYPAGHNDCPPDWRVFWKDVGDFLDRSGVLPAPNAPRTKPKSGFDLQNVVC